MSGFYNPMPISLWKFCITQNKDTTYLAGMWIWCSWNLYSPVNPLFTCAHSPEGDRSAQLFLSTCVDRFLCVPCQLWLVRSTGGGEALTGSDRSRRRPAPVHHLSAHAQWVPDGPFIAVCNTGQLPSPRWVCRFLRHVFFFTLSAPVGNSPS